MNTVSSTKGNGTESIKKAARHLMHDASAGVAEVGGDFTRLKNEVFAAVIQAISAARHSAADKASDAYDSVRERSARTVKELEKKVAGNPLTSLAIAAGAGMLVGIFFLRRHHSRTHRAEDKSS